MALSFAFFSDPALSLRIDYDVVIQQALSSVSASDICVWFGSPLAGSQCQASSAPGVDPIVVSIHDVTPGSNSPATDLRLSLSASGIASAQPGAAISLPHTVLGGAENAVAVYICLSNSLVTTGRRNNLSLITPVLVEMTL